VRAIQRLDLRADALAELSSTWRFYELASGHKSEADPDTMEDLVAMFTGRCFKGFTNQPVDALAEQDAQFCDFVPIYLKAEIQHATWLT